MTLTQETLVAHLALIERFRHSAVDECALASSRGSATRIKKLPNAMLDDAIAKDERKAEMTDVDEGAG